MNKKRLVLRCCLVTVLGLGACCGQTPDPPDSRTVRLPATADIWLSDAMPQERTSSAGKHPRMKLKNIQEMGAIRFDATAAAGYQVRAARLFLRRAGQDKLRYLRISTINQDWTEGNSHVSYGPADGATFLAASVEGEKSRPWAWPGSSFADVTMSSGNTLGCWAARKEHDDGWISVPLTADLIYALTTGDTDGLAVMDGGNPANFNNFIFTKESGPNAPYIEVALGEPLTAVPKKPVVSATAAPERAGLGRGAVRISIEPDPDVFCWQLRRDGQPVPRWQVKHPARSGPTVFYLEDLQPRHTYRLEVTATSRGAKRSPPAEMTVRSSPAMPVDAGLGKFVRTEVKRTRTPSNGPLAVWPLPGLVKVDPLESRALCDDLNPAGTAPAAQATNAVWDGNRVGLFGARGECVSFQLCIENRIGEPLADITVLPRRLKHVDGPAIGLEGIELYRNWYAKDRQGQWQPAYCVPLARLHQLAIPDPQRQLPEQTNQTIYVDIYVPKDAVPGDYIGSIGVMAAGTRFSVALPVVLTVADFTLPDRLSFWPELNAYQRPQRVSDYYRLAHDHRCVLNCMGWRPKLSGAGKDIRVDWTDYDRDAGPLLSGEAFRDSRRPGVPVECMYLPFDDSWPTKLSPETYAYPGHWPKGGESIDHITEHYLKAPYIGHGLSDDYKRAFLSVQRQFVEHFRDKGYTRTEMQCFFGSKATHRIKYGLNTWWTTDEPYFWDDWLALQFFCHLWTAGRRTAAPDEPSLWAARADISRPQWQGRTLAGVVDAAYFGAGAFASPEMIRRCRTLGLETGLEVRSYGTLNRDDTSNTRSLVALVDAWSNGADAFLPWQTLGSAESLDTNDRGASGGVALLVPGVKFGIPVVGDMRLKALRDGQQLIEYLTLLSERRNLTRQQIRAMIHQAVTLQRQSRPGAGVDNADAMEFGTLDTHQIDFLRRRIAAMIVE